MDFWDVVGSIFWFMILFAWIGLVFRIFGDLFGDHELSGWGKALWTVFLIFVPWLGALVYLIARGRSMNERALARARRNEQAFSQYVRETAGAEHDQYRRRARQARRPPRPGHHLRRGVPARQGEAAGRAARDRLPGVPRRAPGPLHDVNRESRPPTAGADRSAAAGGGGAPEAGVGRAAGRFGSRWTNERELADAIHGTVVGAAVMVAASLHGTLGQVVITVVATLFVYWATERYAELLAAGARGRVLDRRNVAAALRHGWPMLESSYSRWSCWSSHRPSVRSCGPPCWRRCACGPCSRAWDRRRAPRGRHPWPALWWRP